MLYGAPPTMNMETPSGLQPVMTLKSRLAMLKTVPAGTKVSYSRTFETRRQTRLGVIPIGYADGYPWALSNKANVLIHGLRAPVVGRVTMDMIIVDVTDIDEARIGSEVVLLGRQGETEITAQELAGLAGTIHYEIFCGISKRMPRVYSGS
jgi:alanine racemase